MAVSFKATLKEILGLNKKQARFDQLRAALTSVPAAIVLGSIYREDDANDEDIYKIELKELCKAFMESSYAYIDHKESSLIHIGHLCYCGGPAISSSMNIIIPHMLDLLKNPYCPTSMRLQVLKTLSEICHSNTAAVEKVRTDMDAMLVIMDYIDDDIALVRESRWAVYLFYVMCYDSVEAMKTLKEMKGLEDNLIRCAAYEFLPWHYWGCNYAEEMLLVLGLKD